MAKDKAKGSDAIDRAAEAVGSMLGSVAGKIESLQAEHPHPMDEAREALAAVASEAGTRAAPMIKKAKAVARRAKKVATQTRRKSRPAAARVARTARKMVKGAKKAVTRGRKSVKRAVGRLKR
jgi:hypothetical protein